MENYKIGRNKMKVPLPSGWHEVPFWKGQRIWEGGLNDIEIMAFLADVEANDIQDSTDFDTVYYLLHAFTYLKRLPENLATPQMPRSAMIGNQRVLLPHALENNQFDLAKASVGQVKDMEMVISTMLKDKVTVNEEGEEVSNIQEIDTMRIAPFLVAIYLQKIIDKEYDYQRAMNLVDRISKEMSFKDVMNIGYFFLQRLSAYLINAQNSSQKLVSPVRKGKLAWSNLVRRLGLTRR